MDDLQSDFESSADCVQRFARETAFCTHSRVRTGSEPPSLTPITKNQTQNQQRCQTVRPPPPSRPPSPAPVPPSRPSWTNALQRKALKAAKI
ncbi:hypothetical protein NQZ68_025468 [Dissostichus eleginoides]|nr:hypothetical protein NQZ68_025468 [Dissostichus eleginoides]